MVGMILKPARKARNIPGINVLYILGDYLLYLPPFAKNLKIPIDFEVCPIAA